MAFAPENVSAGIVDDYGESLLAGAAFSELVLSVDPPPPKLDQRFQTCYLSSAEALGIHTYLLELASPRRLRPAPKSSTRRCNRAQPSTQQLGL